MSPLPSACLIVFFEAIAVGTVLVALGPYAKSMDASDLMVGVLFACIAAPKLLGNPLWGRYSDRSGRRRTMIMLCLGAAMGSALWPLAPTLGAHFGGALLWLTLARLIHGVFSSQATVAFAIASDVTSPEKRTHALALLGIAFGGGMTVGFPLGGYLAESLGLAKVGWLLVGLELAGAAVAIMLLRETTHHVHVADPIPWSRLFKRPRFTQILATCLLTTIGLSVLTPTLTLYVQERFDFDESDAGLSFLLFGIVGMIVQGGVIRPMVNRLGNVRTYIIGTLIEAIGFVMLGLLVPVNAMWAALVFIGAGAGLTSPTISAMFSLAVPRDMQGMTHGINQSVFAAARTIAYVSAGAAFDAGPGIPYLIGAGLLIVGLLPAWGLANHFAQLESPRDS